MNHHADKAPKDKSKTNLGDTYKNKASDNSSFQLIDNRLGAAVQGHHQEMANNSSRSMQLKSFLEMANNSQKVKQATQLRAIADNYFSRRQDTVQRRENNAPSSDGLPVVQLQLATGPYRLKNKFFRTNLRNDDNNKTVKAKLPARQQLMVIPNGAKISNFRAGLTLNEHSWVQTQNNGRGWIEDSMLEPAPFFNHAANQGSFIGNLNNRNNYLQELEQHVNLGSNYNGATNTLNVVDARIQEAAVHLNQGQNAQIAHIGNALTGNANPAIYDATIANHAAKNALWHQALPLVDAGLNTVNAPMSGPVKLKAKTALAQIMSTASGFDVMNQVNQLSAALAIPINYVEDHTQQNYNLFVRHHFGGVNADILQSLDVVLPPDNLFTDAQSFKRVSDVNLAGNSDVTQVGRGISVSPVDTDLLHEFTHALHYLTFENRRRTAALNQGHDQADYHVQTGGAGLTVLRDQDNIAETRTIHRNQSFADLGALAHGAIDPTIPATQEQHDAFTRMAAFTQNLPAENDYRAELGLRARQDHRAMRITPNGTFQQNGYEPIVSA